MSTQSKITTAVSMTLLACFGLPGMTHADPLPGQILKFQQLPLSNTNVGGTLYNGHAEPSTAYQYVNSQGLTAWQGSFAADDFADNLSTPIVHIKWWGDYINNPNNTPVTQFLISFESDIPAVPPQNGVPGQFSRPGTPLLNQIVTAGALSPGSGTFVETQPNTTIPMRQYNAELNLGQSFPELKDTVYWLKIVALTNDAQMVWGWHNRNYMVQDTLASPNVTPGEIQIGPAFQPMWHFQDDAVRGGVDINTIIPGGLSVNQQVAPMQPSDYIDFIDGPAGPNPGQGIGGYSQDLAFEIYTSPVPEPSTMSLALFGACALLARRRRSTRR